MNAGDLAAVVVTIVSLGATALLTIAVLSLLRTMRELRGVLDTLHDQTMPLVHDLRVTIDQAGVDLERVEGILDSAERITHTVDSASKLTYRALSPPLIKTVSLMSGLRRAGRRLLGRPTPAVPTDPRPAELVDDRSHRAPRSRRGRDRTAPSTRTTTNRRR
jgi:hypothetical protein